MHYPKSIQKGDLIGISAPSAGVGHKLEHFDKALAYLHQAGFPTKETAHVRRKSLRSASARLRAREWESCFSDEAIKAVLCAAGGEFLMEILPEIRWKTIMENPKWFMGMSDPSTLLFLLPVCFDIATLYGHNVGAFDEPEELRSQQDALAYLQGDFRRQESFSWCYEGLVTPESKKIAVAWKTPNGEVDVSGRLIGGCVDALRDLVGTDFDFVKEFVNRYQEDGIIWFFDNFALKAEELYHCLWQMKQAGWFEHVKAVVLGRTLFRGSFIDMTYEEALQKVFGKKIPMISEADIGHTTPCFTLVNGGYAHFVAKEGKGSVSFEKK